MPAVFLKTSDHEPNFSFASINGQIQSVSPDSADFHSDQSDVVLQKVDANYFDYRGAIGEGVSSMSRGIGGSDQSLIDRLSDHCRFRWGFYVTLAFGLISISGCIAAGIALSAVQPYLIAEMISTTTNADGTLSSPTNDHLFHEKLETTVLPVTETSTRVSTNSTNNQPDLSTRILSAIHDAGMQETSLELRNTTPFIFHPESRIQEDRDIFQFGGGDELTEFRTPFRQIPVLKYRTKPPRFFHVNEDNREPDRFPDATRVMADPRFHHLNISFDDTRRVRRSSSLEKSGMQVGMLKMMKPAVNGEQQVEKMMHENWDFGEGKSSLPGKEVVFKPACKSGFEWSVPANQCLDVNECVHLGIRACGINSECSNLPGTYSCRCNPGFRLDIRSLACMDIDECKESNGECSPLALCENQPGGFICRCMDGFFGNGVICEIDTTNVPAEKIDPVSSHQCQTTFPPRLHQIISNLYFPDNFPVLSRYRFCVQKLHPICKIRVMFRNFLPSTANHQEFDFLRIANKIFTGVDLNGQELILLDSTSAPLDFEFATDSELNGNRFTLDVTQEICLSTIIVPACSSLLKVDDEVISSVGPHYMDNIICTTALYPPNTACGMQLNFHEFSLEGPRETCPYDFLDINEDKLCGNMKHELREIIFQKGTAKIPIIFSTDSSFVSRGFNISFVWITECL